VTGAATQFEWLEIRRAPGAVQVAAERPVELDDDDPLPQPEPAPPPYPGDDPPIDYPLLPPSGPAGPGS
jgi:hypothetical protein